eukprot:CCRYP_000428-RA/>CCRYP_000428-RA protein AED:0.21 eAED:0.35 QI:0/0/0.5/1/0/0/2/674/59
MSYLFTPSIEFLLETITGLSTTLSSCYDLGISKRIVQYSLIFLLGLSTQLCWSRFGVTV